MTELDKYYNKSRILTGPLKTQVNNESIPLDSCTHDEPHAMPKEGVSRHSKVKTQTAQTQKDTRTLSYEPCDLHVKYERMVFAMEDLHLKYTKAELELKMRDEQLAALHQSLLSDAQKRDKILQEETEGATRLENLTQEKDETIRKADMGSGRYREILYPLEDSRSALATLKEELTSHLKQRDESHQVEISAREEHFKEQEESFQKTLAEKEESHTPQLLELREQLHKETVANEKLSETCTTWERTVWCLEMEKSNLEMMVTKQND